MREELVDYQEIVMIWSTLPSAKVTETSRAPPIVQDANMIDPKGY